MTSRTPLILGSLGLAALTATARHQNEIQPEEVCSHHGLFVDSCFTVHGRMAAYNGNPPYRIWIVGTKRILGVDDYRGCVVLPALDTLIGVEDKLVYADFVVRPVTADQPGVMRMVCIASATHIVTRPAYFIHPPPR